MKSERQLISDANDILRSLYGVIRTRGQENYNWDAIQAKVENILGEQHEYLLDTCEMFKEVSNRKPFFTANVRDILDLHTEGEISFYKMVELLNDVVLRWRDKPCRYEVSMVECDLCKNEWVAVRPEGTPKLECKQCGNISNFENINTDE